MSSQPYESIIANGTKDTASKLKALQHLLDTLPTRHTALALSYNDPDMNFVDLSDECANLLEELQNPSSDVDLGDWFNKVVSSKRFINSVAALEKDMREEEQGRMQELRSLKAIQVSLMAVRDDGELGKSEVMALLEAMEKVGVELSGYGLER